MHGWRKCLSKCAQLCWWCGHSRVRVQESALWGTEGHGSVDKAWWQWNMLELQKAWSPEGEAWKLSFLHTFLVGTASFDVRMHMHDVNHGDPVPDNSRQSRLTTSTWFLQHKGITSYIPRPHPPWEHRWNTHLLFMLRGTARSHYRLLAASRSPDVLILHV
jgi:hypothetical protein